jgi:hypothetical protein
MLIFLQCSERISTARTLHEIYIYKLRISKSLIFCCCHCSCYRYYCSSLTAIFHLYIYMFPQPGTPVKRP